MSTTLATAVVVVVVALAVGVAEARRRHRETTLVGLLEVFGPSLSRVQADPRELVSWGALGHAARQLFPEAFRDLDRASDGRFPFSTQLVEAVHARWTTQWLAWEREHDAEYKRRAAEVETQLSGATEAEVVSLRARLAEIEQQKLQRYQERYEEYVRIGNAIREFE